MSKTAKEQVVEKPKKDTELPYHLILTLLLILRILAQSILTPQPALADEGQPPQEGTDLTPAQPAFKLFFPLSASETALEQLTPFARNFQLLLNFMRRNLDIRIEEGEGHPNPAYDPEIQADLVRVFLSAMDDIVNYMIHQGGVSPQDLPFWDAVERFYVSFVGQPGGSTFVTPNGYGSVIPTAEEVKVMLPVSGSQTNTIFANEAMTSLLKYLNLAHLAEWFSNLGTAMNFAEKYRNGGMTAKLRVEADLFIEQMANNLNLTCGFSSPGAGLVILSQMSGALKESGMSLPQSAEIYRALSECLSTKLFQAFLLPGGGQSWEDVDLNMLRKMPAFITWLIGGNPRYAPDSTLTAITDQLKQEGFWVDPGEYWVLRGKTVLTAVLSNSDLAQEGLAGDIWLLGFQGRESDGKPQPLEPDQIRSAEVSLVSGPDSVGSDRIQVNIKKLDDFSWRLTFSGKNFFNLMQWLKNHDGIATLKLVIKQNGQNSTLYLDIKPPVVSQTNSHLTQEFTGLPTEIGPKDLEAIILSAAAGDLRLLR